jgi:hypothetical protein
MMFKDLDVNRYDMGCFRNLQSVFGSYFQPQLFHQISHESAKLEADGLRSKICFGLSGAHLIISVIMIILFLLLFCEIILPKKFISSYYNYSLSRIMI